jgi:hypothetical protein
MNAEKSDGWHINIVPILFIVTVSIEAGGTIQEND